jgi:E3 ubiquitin-protein ligase RNF14
MDEAYEAEDAANMLSRSAGVAAVPEVGEGDEVAREEQILADRLQVCEDCGFAFCKLCSASWHGEFYDCRPRSQTMAGRAQLSKEEEATKDFIVQHTTPCPSCAAPVQKSQWCNHITCTQCNSHFCYLCGRILSPTEPYKHYADKFSKCYSKVWI